CTHRPRTANGEPCPNYRSQKPLPASAGSTINAIALSLLEGIVNGDWKCRMPLLGKLAYGPGHPVHEKHLGLLFATMPVGRNDKLFRFRNCEGSEKLRERRLQ